MANPAAGFLPAFFDPLLEYLSNNLPGPIYSVIIKLLSHSLAGLFAFIKLCNTLLANAPEDWNAQNILPPIITIFAAYLAISSFYRTTSWLLRISFWFMKWGAMFGVFVAGVGYLLGTADGNALGNRGGIPALGGLFGTLLEDPRRTTATRSKASHNKKPSKKRPKAWDSFDRHKDWQYQEGGAGKGNQQAQEIISQIVDAAGNMFGGAWWGALKSIAGETGVKSSAEDSTARSKASSKSKGNRKAGKS